MCAERVEQNPSHSANPRITIMGGRSSFPWQVHELERSRRSLETEAQSLRVQTQELEEELAEAENSRLRLEVTLQALRAQFEREISSKEEKGEEKRRALSKQVWEERVATKAP